MAEYEKVHYLTEAIFKNVLDNFNPGVKQLISTGRSLQKALHNVTTQAKAYIECIYTLAQSAQVCKGATSDIGAALLQIAEVHKEINTQVIDNIKSFHSDLLIPLETKQENEFKHIQLIHKKYLAGHKFYSSAFDKSQTALKKHKKKGKAKYGFDQKELQYTREVKDNLQKLEEYQFQNLRLSLLEERKRYCFLLDRVCAMVRNYSSHHSKAHELFTHRLSEWSNLHKGPHILPMSTEAVINAFRNQEELYNNPDEQFEPCSSLEYERQHSSNGSREDNNSLNYGNSPHLHMGLEAGEGLQAFANFAHLTNGGMAYQSHFNQSENQRERSRGLVRPAAHNRALYTHSGVGETQLSFVTGDLIRLVGEIRDGWHYGENTRTNRSGWFPISFTETVQLEESAQTQESGLTTSRVKSLGNLSDLRELNQEYHLAAQMSGHSDSDSASIRMREPRVNFPERPVSMHGTGLQIPSNLRLCTHSPKSDNGGISRRLSYHPRQPSIPEDDDNNNFEHLINPNPFNLSAFKPIVPAPRHLDQRHTLAYATTPVLPDIFMGRRHSTTEQFAPGRMTSLVPPSRLRDRINCQGGFGLRSSPVIEMSRPSARMDHQIIPEITCIPPPEEFSDLSAQQRKMDNHQQPL